MKIGRKLYYDKATGQVILLTNEQNSRFAKASTWDEDFARYRELSGRNAETVDVLQLEYGQHRGDFEKATSFAVDLNTNEVVFELPEAFKSHEAAIRALETEKMRLEEVVSELTGKNASLEMQLTDTQLALTEIFETLSVTDEQGEGING